MNFFCNDSGTIFHVDSEKVYQGSAYANTIYFIAPFPSSLTVTMQCELPNGAWTEPQLLTKVNINELKDMQTVDGKKFNVWTCKLHRILTELRGTVTVQFACYSNNGHENEEKIGARLCTASSSFEVLPGVPYEFSNVEDVDSFIIQILGELQLFNATLQEYSKGKSAYEIWLENGNTGTEEDFLNSLKGKDAKIQFSRFF